MTYDVIVENPSMGINHSLKLIGDSKRDILLLLADNLGESLSGDRVEITIEGAK